MTCPLCTTDGGQLVWRGTHLRVIRADEPGFPAFYRVVWNAHVAEFSDLTQAERQHCLDAVAVVEQVLREHLAPPEVRLAALGNLVLHLLWHVIARVGWDSHFPAPVWASAQRERDSAQEAVLRERLPALDAALHELLERSLPSGG